MLLFVLVGIASVSAQTADHQKEARQILEKLVSYRSAAGHGAQLVATARYIESTLRAGGLDASDVLVLPHKETAAVLARVRGTDASRRPILFSSHFDVVDARPEDWQRSPFVLVEENGMFFGRGTIDNKTGVTSLMSTILRLQRSGQRPQRTLVFAFIGDEETAMETTRLVAAHEWVRNAEYAINSDAGGGGLTDDGRATMYAVQGAEKTYIDFTLTATNPGGHSSWPRDDNAIYDMARALARVEQLRFPVMTNALTLGYLKAAGESTPGTEGEVLRRFVANPADADAAEALRRMPEHIGTTRTTCVATLIDGGHAPNALPQKVTANVNCRVFPGHSADAVRKALIDAIDNPKIEVDVPEVAVSPVSEPRADVMAAIARSIHARYPGVPIVPYMESGGTDGLVYRNAGIPTWATPGVFMKSSDMFAHGLNERVPVKSFYEAIDHIHDLAIALGGVR
jgi:carboxypeptidase PM20D1